MLLELAVVALIAVLAAALVFRDRVAVGVSAIAGVIFVGLAVVALTAVFVPDLYQRAATISLEQTGVLAQVRQLDDQLVLNDVADVSGDLLGRIQDFLGQPTPAPPAVPRPETRLIEQNLFPGLVSIVSTLFRIGALLLSLSGMVAVVALQYASALYVDRSDLRAAMGALEGRVAGLEMERAAIVVFGDATSETPPVVASGTSPATPPATHLSPPT